MAERTFVSEEFGELPSISDEEFARLSAGETIKRVREKRETTEPVSRLEEIDLVEQPAKPEPDTFDSELGKLPRISDEEFDLLKASDLEQQVKDAEGAPRDPAQETLDALAQSAKQLKKLAPDTRFIDVSGVVSAGAADENSRQALKSLAHDASLTIRDTPINKVLRQQPGMPPLPSETIGQFLDKDVPAYEAARDFMLDQTQRVRERTNMLVPVQTVEVANILTQLAEPEKQEFSALLREASPEKILEEAEAFIAGQPVDTSVFILDAALIGLPSLLNLRRFFRGGTATRLGVANEIKAARANRAIAISDAVDNQRTTVQNVDRQIDMFSKDQLNKSVAGKASQLDEAFPTQPSAEMLSESMGPRIHLSDIQMTMFAKDEGVSLGILRDLIPESSFIKNPVQAFRELRKIFKRKGRLRRIKDLQGKSVAEVGPRLGMALRAEREQRVGAAGELFFESRGQLARQGEGGARLVRRLDASKEEWVILSATARDRVSQAFRGLTPQQSEQVGMLLDVTRRNELIGKTIDPAVLSTVRKIRQAARPLVSKMRALGMFDEAGTFLKEDNLFQHIYAFENSDIVNETIFQIMSSRKFREANKGADQLEMLEFAKNEFLNTYLAKGVRSRRFGVLDDSQRLSRDYGVNTFEKNPQAVIEATLDSYARRIADTKHLGLSDVKALEDIADIKAAGFDAKFASQVFDAQVLGKVLPGRFPEGLKNVTSAIRGWNVITKLHLAQLRNAGQTFANTIPRTNFWQTMRGIAQWYRDFGPDPTRSMDRLQRIADKTILQSMRDYIRTGAGIGSERVAGTNLFSFTMLPEKALKSFGFISIELFNRRVSFNAGTFYMDEMAQVLRRTRGLGSQGLLAQRKLAELGVTANRLKTIQKTGRLSDKEKLKGGIRVINDSQFQTDVLDLPLFWSSDVGRFTFQFKTFGFRHAMFVKRHVIEEAAVHRNFKPLAALATVGGLTGLTTQSAVDFFRGRAMDDILINKLVKGKTIDDPDNARWKNVLQSYASIGGIGLYMDMVFNIFPEFLGERRWPGRILSAFVGPGATETAEITEIVSQMARAKAAKLTKPEISELRKREFKRGELPPGAIRRAMQRVPLVGPAIGRTIAPEKRRGRLARFPKRPAIVEVGEAALGAITQPEALEAAQTGLRGAFTAGMEPAARITRAIQNRLFRRRRVVVPQ